MPQDPQDPRLALILGLDLPACRIEFSDSPIVLLCGGKVNTKNKLDAPTPPVGSLRHAITEARTSFEVFRPEEITGWQSDGVFKDLMSFERELASICSLVVIILESEGALVELGAFSQLAELSDKIIAICPSEHRTKNSFINLGILRFISEKKPSSVKSYPWDINRPIEINPEVVGDAISDITEELAALQKSQVFKQDQSAHIIVIICEILRLFIALKEGEILEYLDHFGIKVTNHELRGKLFLLEEFRLIKTQVYSDSKFYLRSDELYHKFRLSHNAKQENSDNVRTEVRCLEYYKTSPKHRNRLRAITLARQQKPL